jgi:hypothetical protein
LDRGETNSIKEVGRSTCGKSTCGKRRKEQDEGECKMRVSPKFYAVDKIFYGYFTE